MWWSPSITASASSASTIHALNDLVFLELLSGHTTDASAVEVGLLGLDTSEAAELDEKLAEVRQEEVQRLDTFS